MTRAMKKLIALCVGSHGDSQSHVSMLSLREKNAIHYMAGYVIMRLFRKYKKAGKQYFIEVKWKPICYHRLNVLLMLHTSCGQRW